MELRELHACDRVHGSVSPSAIALTPGGAEVVFGAAPKAASGPEDDVRGFGSVLYEMLTGAPPLAEGPFGMPFVAGPLTGPSAIRPAAQRLALRCMAGAPPLATIQHALSEVRVLAILARQYGFRPIPEPPPPPEPPATPFLVPPPAGPGRDVPADPRAAGKPHPFLNALHARMVDAAFPAVESPSTAAAASDTADVLKAEVPESRTQPSESDMEEGQPCPRCGSASVYLSRSRTHFERILESCGIPACRCHRCDHRWVAFAHMRIVKKAPPARNNYPRNSRRG